VAILVVYSFATKTGASAHIGAEVARPARPELAEAGAEFLFQVVAERAETEPLSLPRICRSRNGRR
jgi:hypothetical protein